MFHHTNTPTMLDLRRLIALTSLSKSTIHRKIKAKQFPAPIHLSERRVAWRSQDVFAWLEACAANPK